MTTDHSALPRRRRRTIRRVVLLVIVIVILAPVAAVAVFVARFDPNAYKPEIAAAMEKATGRQLALKGPLSLRLSLVPTISAENVTLGNPAGFSHPDMASLARLDAKIALVPLLSGRFEIRSVVVVRPDIAIEINKSGQSNLSFAAPRAATGEANAAPAAAGSKRPVAINIRAIRIEDGRLSWQDDRSGQRGILELRSFTATSASGGEPVTVAAEGVYAGLPFTLRGQTGPLARLIAAGGATPPWPVQLVVTEGTAQLSLTGNVADPAVGRGYHLHLEATAPALEALGPLVPGTRLPALHGIALSADLADEGGRLPQVSNLSLAAGASDLGALRPGLSLTALSLTVPRLDQPCKLTLAGAVGGAGFSLVATLGPPAALLPPGFGLPVPAAPWPVAIQATAAGSNISVSGTITEPQELAGASLAVSAQIPDLARLAPFAGRTLPALAQIAFSGQIADAETGWREWVRLSALALSLPQGDLAGDATLGMAGPRPAVTAALTSKRLDLGALSAVFAASKAGGATPQPPGTPPGTPPPGTPPGAPPREAHAAARLIPDTKLPFGLLKEIDADVSFGVGSLTVGGVSYGNVTGKLALKDGRLTVDPFGGQAPGGHVALTGSVDANAAAPPVALTLAAPALALKPLMSAFGLPADASGTLQVEASLSGAGDTPHRIAAGLNGQVGVAMAGGSLDNQAIEALLSPVIRAARLPPGLFGNGESQVRCFAVRVDAVQGTGLVKALLLEMSGLTISGSGSLALGPETLALSLDPALRYSGTLISLPMHVGGTFLDPKVEPDAAGVAGSLAKPESTLQRILGALRGSAAPPAPDCGPPLALARFGQPGPAPPAPAPPQGGAPAAKPNSPLNLLRGLFHQ